MCVCACACVHMQDIATYTRIAPSEREVSFKKFVDRVNKCPKVCVYLTNWITLL